MSISFDVNPLLLDVLFIDLRPPVSGPICPIRPPGLDQCLFRGSKQRVLEDQAFVSGCMDSHSYGTATDSHPRAGVLALHCHATSLHSCIRSGNWGKLNARNCSIIALHVAFPFGLWLLQSANRVFKRLPSFRFVVRSKIGSN
jgi:hypothetical protein